MRRPERIPRVFIAGDWDADGIIASALILYSQERLGLYPIKSKALVDLKPFDPEKFKFFISELRTSYDAIVLLDIPYFPKMENIFRLMKEHIGIKKIILFDHHISTLNNVNKLKELVDELYVGREPTAKLVYDVLRKNNVPVTDRLRIFVETVSFMDKGIRVPKEYMKMLEIVSLFSKALTIKRDEEIWITIVKWLANPLPLPQPLDPRILEKVREAVKKRDEELKSIATDLALSAQKVGYLKFVDARRKWKKRGSTALASKIAHILKSPVAVLFTTTKNYDLLIIKASGGKAYRVAKYLLGEGIALDIAGHPNLAIVRVPKDIDINKLMHALQRASLYM